LWKVTAPRIELASQVARGAAGVLVASAVLGGRPGLAALDAWTGEVRWQARFETVPRPLAISGGRALAVLSGGEEQTLVVLDAASGREIWRTRVASDGHASATADYVAFTERSAIWLLDVTTHARHRVVIDDDPSGLQRLDTHLADDVVYVVDHGFGARERILSIDPHSGRIRSVVDTSDDPLTFRDAAVVLGGWFAGFHRDSHDVVVRDATGAECWRWGIGGMYVRLVAGPGVLLVDILGGGTRNERVLAFGPETAAAPTEEAIVEGRVTLPCGGRPTATAVRVGTVVVQSGGDGQFEARVRARGTITVSAPAGEDPYGTQVTLVGAGRYHVDVTAFDHADCEEPDERP
jgi:outer membrane protein assembly factor BamB